MKTYIAVALLVSSFVSLVTSDAGEVPISSAPSESPTTTFFVTTMYDNQLRCGEVTMPSRTASWLERWSRLSPGTCGLLPTQFAIQHKSTTSVPSVGEVTFTLYGSKTEIPLASASSGGENHGYGHYDMWSGAPTIFKVWVVSTMIFYFVAMTSILGWMVVFVSWALSRCSSRYRALSRPKQTAIALFIVAAPFCPMLTLFCGVLVGGTLVVKGLCARRPSPDAVLRNVQVGPYTQFDPAGQSALSAPPPYIDHHVEKAPPASAPVYA